MKRKMIHHIHEEARIYEKNYKPSFNIIRLIFSVFSVLISGQSQTAHDYRHRK